MCKNNEMKKQALHFCPLMNYIDSLGCKGVNEIGAAFSTPSSFHPIGLNIWKLILNSKLKVKINKVLKARLSDPCVETKIWQFFIIKTLNMQSETIWEKYVFSIRRRSCFCRVFKIAHMRQCHWRILPELRISNQKRTITCSPFALTDPDVVETVPSETQNYMQTFLEPL